MAIKILTSADFTDKGVTGLADIPNLSATEMQRKFDEIGREVLTPKLNETIEWTHSHENAENPHAITKQQVGLDKVDNTSDAEKPVSEAQAMYAMDLFSQATMLTAAHENNTDNPHGVTAEQIGAATPAFVHDAIATVTGEGEGVASHAVLQHRDAKDQHPIAAVTGLSDALTQLQSHANSTENPHGVTASQIGAAPSGYGLGEESKECADCNLATGNGFYRLNGTNCVNYPDRIANFKYGAMITVTRRTNTASKTVYQLATYNNAYAVRCGDAETGQWEEWRYVNPPLITGAEYKTTAQYNGKAVYAKLINFGALPTSGSKTAALSSVSTSSNIVSIEGIAIKDGDSAIPFPMIDTSNGTIIANVLVTNNGTLVVYVYKDLSAYNAQFIVKYTKD